MKKLFIEPGCTTCGLCEFIAPEVFQVTDISHVKDGANLPENQEAIKEAAKNCPEVVRFFGAISMRRPIRYCNYRNPEYIHFNNTI